MTRGPRYVPRYYERDRNWRVYDTWMQLPLTKTYSEFRDCKTAAKLATRQFQETQRDKKR